LDYAGRILKEQKEKMPYIGTLLSLRLHFHSTAVTISSAVLSVAAFFPKAPETWL
jgi:hypothetical protein